MGITQLHEEFLSYLDLERGYSPLTITSYRSDFRLFLRHLTEGGEEVDLEKIDRPAIRRYIAELRTQELNPSTIARYLNSLRSFWHYLRANGYTECDPFLGISVPKRSRPMPVYLSAKECTALLEASERQRSTHQAFRDKAVLSLLIFAGLRRAELLDLRLTSIDLGQGTLRVERGKGDKCRVLPLLGLTVEALRDWLELRPKCDHDYLFTSQGRTRLGRKGLRGVLHRALMNAGLQRAGVTLHTLRHSFACLMLQGGCDLFSLSKMLGHTRLDTTAIYLHASVEDLRSSVARHPLNVG